MTTCFFDNHLTRWMRSNGIPVATVREVHKDVKGQHDHRRISQRRGIFNAHGRKMSIAALRLKELGGCNLTAVYPEVFANA